MTPHFLLHLLCCLAQLCYYCIQFPLIIPLVTLGRVLQGLGSIIIPLVAWIDKLSLKGVFTTYVQILSRV